MLKFAGLTHNVHILVFQVAKEVFARGPCDSNHKDNMETQYMTNLSKSRKELSSNPL